MNKICEFCQSEFIPPRSDTRFCSKTCKSKFWYNQRKTPVENNNELHSSLKGVIDERAISLPQEEYETIQVKTDSLEYKRLQKLEAELLLQKSQFENKIKKVELEITQISNKNGQAIKILCTGIGGFITDPQFKKPTNNLLGAITGLALGTMLNDSVKDERERVKNQAIQYKKQELDSLKMSLSVIIAKLSGVKIRLVNTPPYIIEEKKQLRQQLALPIENTQTPSAIQVTKPAIINSNTQPLVINKSSKESGTGKIISSEELFNHEYLALEFKNEWYDFIGFPSINFQCAIHGRAGEGKSTFAIKFIMYLAENFGKSIYISSEEGFSKTFKDKFVRNNAKSDNLFVADLKTMDEIIKEIPVNTYNFICIDSLDNMRIDAEKLKQLRERYKGSSIITISQATKDGKMRGSYEIIHDVDIEIIVTNGVAITNKNRFKEKDLELRVF